MAENKKQTQKKKPTTTAKDEKDKTASTDTWALTPEQERKSDEGQSDEQTTKVKRELFPARDDQRPTTSSDAKAAKKKAAQKIKQLKQENTKITKQMEDQEKILNEMKRLPTTIKELETILGELKQIQKQYEAPQEGKEDQSPTTGSDESTDQTSQSEEKVNQLTQENEKLEKQVKDQDQTSQCDEKVNQLTQKTEKLKKQVKDQDQTSQREEKVNQLTQENEKLKKQLKDQDKKVSLHYTTIMQLEKNIDGLREIVLSHEAAQESAATIRILTQNCNGLNKSNKSNKRGRAFKILEAKRCQIICLQETHFTVHGQIEEFQRDTFHHYFSNLSSQSHGVCTYIDKNLYRMVELKQDLNGTYVAMKLIIREKEFTLINIYRPNSGYPNYIPKIQRIIEEFNTEFVILCGDFNAVQYPEDRPEGSLNYQEDITSQIKELKKKHLLYDPWQRDKNEECYTCEHKGNKSRIDYFLISTTMEKWVQRTKIQRKDFSDHKSVILTFKML